VWAATSPWPLRLAGTVLGLVVATVGYTYPVVRYLQRSGARLADPLPTLRPTLSRMLLGACLGGVALTSTWGASQWIPLWADQLAGGSQPQARPYTQIASALGAIVGTITGAMLGKWLGRRIIYSLLCVS